MKKIIKPRGKGKTTELIKLSAKTNTYILVRDRKRQRRVAELADSMNINIPYPVTLDDYMRTQFRGSFINHILIDDADDILQRFFNTVVIDAITITEVNADADSD